MKTSTRVICALAKIETLRATASYAALCDAADAAVMEVAQSVSGPFSLNSFTETPLWLAAERMVRAGKLEQYIANVYELPVATPMAGLECPVLPPHATAARG